MSVDVFRWAVISFWSVECCPLLSFIPKVLGVAILMKLKQVMCICHTNLTRHTYLNDFCQECSTVGSSEPKTHR